MRAYSLSKGNFKLTVTLSLTNLKYLTNLTNLAYSFVIENIHKSNKIKSKTSYKLLSIISMIIAQKNEVF